VPIPKLVVTAALMAAQVAIGAMRKTEGPRLDNTHVTLADYGTPIPDIWGMKRIEGCPVFWAEELREQKKKTKGKAGKYAEYKYYGTWAVAICGHEIEAVAKILFDNHPVYQMTGEGPIASLMSAIVDPESRTSIKISNRNIAIYLGTETQEPDPRMEAWYEDQAEFGADCCPAHRGLAYIVFKDIPLEKFGNRIPQVTIDAVSIKSDNLPYETATTANNTDARWAFGGGWGAYVNNVGIIEWWDVATRSVIGMSPEPGLHTGSVGYHDVSSVGTVYYAGLRLVPTTRFLVSSGPLGVPEMREIVTTNTFSHTRLVGDTPYTAFSGGATGYVADTVVIPHVLVARDFAADEDGEAWGIFQPSGASDSFTLERLDGSVSHDFTGSVARLAISDARLTFYNGKAFIHGGDGFFYIVDPVDGSLDDSGATSWTTPFFRHDGTGHFWVAHQKVSLEDGSILQANDPDDWVSATHSNPQYEPITHAFWERASPSDDINILYLDRIGSEGVTFGQILEEEGERVNFEVDGSALDQTVLGYSVTQGSVRDRLAPLFDIHDSILRPHDFTYVGLKRGTSSLGTILTENFVREGGEARYTIDIAQDTDLPQRLDVRYADATADQQVNTVTSVRHTVAIDSVRVQSIDLTTYVDTPDAMQQKADRFLRRQHNSKATIQNALTAKYLAVEPGDIYDLNLDGVLWTAQLEKLTFSAGALKCEWRRTFPSLNALGSGTGPDMGGHTPEEIFISGPVKGFVLDIPLVEDADNSINPLIYYAAGGYGAGLMPGAAVLQGDAANDDAYDEIASVASSDMATWGYTIDALGDANPNLWDRGNSVNVAVRGGTLSTVTEAQINANPLLNMAAMRNQTTGETELFNFATATLEVDGTYTLTNLLRGRRGTEGAVAGHAIGDEFVLVEDLGIEPYGLSDLGSEMFFKVQTFGRDPDFATPIEVDFEAATLKPYAPARIDWDFDGTDLQATIIRRTRVGGAWTGGSTIPLGENSEEYEIDVLDGSDVVRTITVTGTNTFTYTAAMAAADGVTLPTPPTVNVYQLSDAVGRGFALAA
jgi:hypothetical protein